MTIKPYPLHKLTDKYEFVPQALLQIPVYEIANRVGADVEKGNDDLDEYIGAGAVLEGFHPFAIMHYNGHPDGTSTIYLPFEVNDVMEITKIISLITSELKLPDESVTWQRRDASKT